MATIHIKKGDTVEVIAGKNRGTKAKVVRVLPETQRIIVEGVNTAKKHRKPRTRSEAGQVLDIDMPIHISNVMLYDDKPRSLLRNSRSEPVMRLVLLLHCVAKRPCHS
jgi:large subunit ribosomal protein L24